MRFSNVCALSFIAVLVALMPLEAKAADPVLITPLDITDVAGARAVRISGTASAGTGVLVAVLHAALAPDLPIVYLTRRAVNTDAAGHFDTLIPLAPAYFGGETISVVLQTAAGAVVARATIRVTDPAATAGPAAPVPLTTR